MKKTLKVKNVLGCLMATSILMLNSGCSKRVAPVTPSVGTKHEQTNTETHTKHRHQKYNFTKYDAGLAGDWVIVKVHTTPIQEGEDMPTLYFSAEDSGDMVYGNLVHNTLNADLSVKEGCRINFSNIVATKESSPNQPQEEEIKQALTQARSYSYDTTLDPVQLSLLNSSDVAVLVLRKFGRDVVSGSWRLCELRGKSTTEKSAIRLIIDAETGSIYGDTGITMISGKAKVETGHNKAIQFSDIRCTKASSEDTAFATSLVVALEETCSYKNIGGTLEFYNDRGKKIISLQRIDR